MKSYQDQAFHIVHTPSGRNGADDKIFKDAITQQPTYDVLVLLSGDSDHISLIRQIRKDPRIKVIVLVSSLCKYSNKLRSVADQFLIMEDL